MDAKKYKIGVVGMGPVGQMLAVHFKEAGCDVAICDIDKEKMNLVRKEGIILEGKIRKSCFFNNVFTSMSEFAPLDLDFIVFAIKSHHTQFILDKVQEINTPKLCVVSAQNGIDSEQQFSEVLGESKTLRMVINFAGNLHAPNVVNVTFFNPPNYVASMDDSKADIAQWIAETLNSVHLETACVSSFDITNKVWEKTILNSALSGLCAISRLTMKEAMEFPDTVEIVEQTIIEAVDVAKAEEIKFGENFVKLCLRYLKKGGDHFPSLAVDLLNKRDTEIDYFNGKIVEYGRKHYIRTPLNLTFTNLVKAATHKNHISKSEQKTQGEPIADL